MTTRRHGAAIVALVASCIAPAVAVATAPPESATMAEAVVATRAEAEHLVEEFAAGGLQAGAAEMSVAACEDSAQMHHPKATVWFGRKVLPGVLTT